MSSVNHHEGELVAGQMLGRYELLTPIATGGMGNVWAARLKGTRGFRKLVAIKTILRSLDNDNLEQMLFREAMLASQIHHPNVAETLELGEHDGILYLVMELVYGESLSFILKEAQQLGGVPFPIAVNLVGQVCRGLQAAHDLKDEHGNRVGLIHRDISPPNVLITDAGTVKIVDFGVATTSSDATYGSGEIKGKISYLAPEQLRGEPLDARVDVFTTGILLYLLTVGKHPFRSAMESTTIARILSDAPATPPSAFVEEYPEALEAVVMRALDKHRETRFGSALEMLEALERAWPDAFGPHADETVAAYVQDVMRDRLQERRNTLRMAEELAEKSGSRDSVRSLPAVVGPSLPPPVPTKHARRTWVGVSALFIGLGAAAVAVPGYLRLLKPEAAPITAALAVREANVPLAPVAEPAPTRTASSDEAPRLGVAGAPQRTASWASLRPSGALRASKRAGSSSSNNVASKDEAKDVAVEAPRADTAAEAWAPAPEPVAAMVPSASAETNTAGSRPFAAVAALAPPVATLAPSRPIAPASTAPRTVPSRIGHGQLRINPNAEGYRVRLPRALDRTGQAFRATVNICVGANGRVSKVKVLRSAGPAIDAQIPDVLSRWRYQPLLADGQAAPFCYVLSYEVVGQ